MHDNHKNLFSRCCWQFLILSSLLLLAFPSTFTNSLWLGEIWLWLMATPILILLVLHRHHAAATWSAALVSGPSRRRRAGLAVQARRKGFGKLQRHRSPLRAA